MANNIGIDSKELVDRWLRSDETLTLNERLYVVEKMIRRLLINESLNKRRKQGG